MKLSILLSILFDLLSKRKITAAYLAQKHELSPRTVYRYVELLSECVPVHIQRGRNGGIFISDCYKLPVDFMTEAEYEAAMEGLELAYATRHEEHYLEAKRKLSAQRKTERQNMDISGEIGSIFIDGNTFSNAPILLEKLQFWEECIKKRTVVNVTLRTKTAKTEEKVEPHAIVFSEGAWHLYAFCHAERCFRLLAIGQVASALKTQETFRARPFQRKNVIAHKELPAPTLSVRLEIDSECLSQAQNWLGAENIRKQKGKWVTEVSLPDNEALPKTILGFGNKVRVLSPASLQEKVQALAKEIAALYN